jgi:hypothetical protein
MQGLLATCPLAYFAATFQRARLRCLFVHARLRCAYFTRLLWCLTAKFNYSIFLRVYLCRFIDFYILSQLPNDASHSRTQGSEEFEARQRFDYIWGLARIRKPSAFGVEMR